MGQAEDDLGAAGATYRARVRTTKDLVRRKLLAGLAAAAADPDYLADIHTIRLEATDNPGGTPRFEVTALEITTRVPAGIRVTE